MSHVWLTIFCIMCSFRIHIFFFINPNTPSQSKNNRINIYFLFGFDFKNFLFLFSLFRIGKTTVCQDNSGQIKNVNKGGRLFCSNENKILIYQADLAISSLDVCPLHFKDPVTKPVCYNLVATNVTSLLKQAYFTFFGKKKSLNLLLINY